MFLTLPITRYGSLYINERRMSVGLCLGGVSQAGTMICNLPLLFADGYPTCLDKITVDQLEKFVPFMIRCSSGNISEKLTAPEWWPNDLVFSIPLVKPPGLDSQWLKILKSLVCRCYTYHGCEFMLQFCNTLSQCPAKNLTFTTSWDGTTSLYNKATGKLLVTFRNENMCYDRRKESQKKTRLRKTNENILESKPSLLDQPNVSDVYLCDCCDAEFGTLKEAQEHEKICRRQRKGPPRCRVPTRVQNFEQEKFLNYFHLVDALDRNKQSVKNVDPPRYKRFLGNSMRYTGIPLSSPLGVLVHKKSRASNISTGVLLDRVERYCSTKPPDSNVRIREPRFSTWPISWKPRKKGEEEQEDWVHVYKIPKRQWCRRAPFMQDEMSLKAMDLFRRCQRFELRIHKLTDQEIKYYSSKCTTDGVEEALTNTFNEVRQHHNSVTVKGERMRVIPQNESDNNGISVKTECEFVDHSYSDSEILNNMGPTDTLESVIMPFGKQLPPNTLYVYDKTVPTIRRSQFQNFACNNTPVPVVDLVSSDEESEVISSREIQEHITTLTQNSYERSVNEAFIPETDLNIEECQVTTNKITYDNNMPSYCFDYESDLPQLVNYLSSSTYQQGDECMFVPMDQRNTNTFDEVKSYVSSVCDKSVQCTYDDFDSTVNIPMDSESVHDGECCLVNEETPCSQEKLPKLFQNRREL